MAADKHLLDLEKVAKDVADEVGKLRALKNDGARDEAIIEQQDLIIGKVDDFDLAVATYMRVEQ